MLADSRAVVSPDRTPVAAGATDLRLDRVFVTNGRNNLIIRP